MRINEEKLRAALAVHKMNRADCLELLAIERNSLAIITMPTLGTFDIDFINREQDARKRLDSLESDAAVNVPLIEQIMTEKGWATETPVCPECGKYRARLSGGVCSMCYEPEEY